MVVHIMCTFVREFQYFDMMTSSSQVIKNVRFVSEEMVHMDWLYLDDLVEVSGRTNVVIAAYTTGMTFMIRSSKLVRVSFRNVVIVFSPILSLNSPVMSPR
jgi:hypothetical protein